MWMRALLLSDIRCNELNAKAMWLWQEGPSVYQQSLSDGSCVWVMRLDGDEKRFWRGQIAFWQGNAVRCQRDVCSSHCPLAHITHVQYTHMLTPSLNPISFAQGMGTPPIPLSSHPSLFLHIIPVLLLTLSPPVLSPSLSLTSPLPLPITPSPCPALSSLCHSLRYPFLPRVVLLSSPCAIFPGVLSLRVLFFFFFYFLPPSVPNLSWARSVFFPDNLFLILQN